MLAFDLTSDFVVQWLEVRSDSGYTMHAQLFGLHEICRHKSSVNQCLVYPGIASSISTSSQLFHFLIDLFFFFYLPLSYLSTHYQPCKARLNLKIPVTFFYVDCLCHLDPKSRNEKKAIQESLLPILTDTFLAQVNKMWLQEVISLVSAILKSR